MDKDFFEIQIKEQLTQMKAPVPEGSWEAIKAQIPSSGAPVPGSESISSFSFGVGIAAGTLLLTSLGVYSELKDVEVNQQSLVQDSIVEESKVDENTTVDNTGTIDYIDAEQVSENQVEQVSSETEFQLDENQSGESFSEVYTDESEAERRDNENLSELPITPIARIDSNGLSTDNSPGNSGERAPVRSDNPTESVTNADDFKAEIVTSVQEGYAPLVVKLHNAADSGESNWQIDGNTSKGSIVETTFKEPGTYDVYLSVYDDGGNLQAEDQIQITVKEGSDIKLPNIFTPNGDGLNDTYRIGYAKNIEDFFIQITDETGRVVYSSSDISEEWDYNQSNGVESRRYTVQYRAIGIDGKVHTDQFPLIIVRD